MRTLYQRNMYIDDDDEREEEIFGRDTKIRSSVIDIEGGRATENGEIEMRIIVRSTSIKGENNKRKDTGNSIIDNTQTIRMFENGKGKLKNFGIESLKNLNVATVGLIILQRLRYNNAKPFLDFHFNNLSLTLPSGKVILNSVSGAIKAGRITAILGGSGCGVYM